MSSKIDQINIGWIDNSYIAYITAITLARHKLHTRKIKINPFIIEPGKLWNSISNKPSDIYYAIGGFTDNEIESILSKRCRVTIIGKFYGEKFKFITKPMKIGSIKLYPVSKEKQYGLEYLSVLIKYFKVDSETRFFLKLSNIRPKLLMVLAVTDSWIDTFNLFISNEIVSTLDDIDNIIEYIMKTKNYHQLLNNFINIIKSSIVVDDKNYTILDFRNINISAKRAEIILKQLIQDRKPLFLIMRGDSEESYNLCIIFRKNFTNINLDNVLKILKSTLIHDRGSLKILNCRISDWNELTEKISVVAKMLSNTY
ncbi:MAG: hypothetical protein QXL19_08390 [Ignisphaera sp.]